MVRISVTLEIAIDVLLTFVASRDGYIHEGRCHQSTKASSVLTLRRKLRR